MNWLKNCSPVILFTIILFLPSCEYKESGSVSGSVNYDFKRLARDFKNPPIEYSTAPFWVWNDVVTKDKIDQQLPEYKRQGISQLFIHPRPGLVTEYLSDEWFELCKYAVDKAKELNMKIWLYDENSYPSGFAGGHVISVMPPSFDPVVGLKLTKLNILQEEDTDKYFIIIKKIKDYFADISGGTSNYLNQPGEYYAFTKWYYPDNQGWYGGFSYVDLLAYGITERFINTTMQGYEAYFGEDLGTWVPGIFTDEPNINTNSDGTVIRFTPVLFNKFKEKYGYQLQNYLPCLYDDVGDWKNVRHDYYALLLDMFIERWAVPWQEYAEEKNLKWTGHYWEHGWPDPRHGGDNMAMYAWHQYPGIDMLFNDEERRPDQFGNVRSVKELSSIVNQLGKERALSETYGGSGWELTFEDMKRNGDWEYALGVNFMNQHLSFMTIKGARKRDYPQSMSYHAPWWNNYKILNTYFERLSLALSCGKQVNRILVLEPTSSAWMYFSPLQEKNHFGAQSDINEFRNSFHGMLNTLEKHQIEYDLGSERMIKDHGDVKGSKFIVGQRAYDLIVLPPYFENFEPYMFGLVKRYLEGGGTVLSFSGVPVHVDGNINRKMPTFINNFSTQWIEKEGINADVIREYFQEKDFMAIDPGSWKGRIFHQRRQYKDGQLLFIVNFDKKEAAKFNFEILGRTALYLDAVTGNYLKFPAVLKDGKLIITDQLEPGGSLLLYISENNIMAETFTERNIKDKSVVHASSTSIKQNKPNSLTLDYCDLEFNGETNRNLYFYDAQERVFKYYLGDVYGFNYNPWSTAIQYRTRILDKNNFDKGTGFKADFPFRIEEGLVPSNMKAIVESPHLFSVSCNGTPVKPIENEWWLDKSFGVFNISDFLKPGNNVITVKADPMDILAELEPVYITGDFCLSPAEHGWNITSPIALDLGSWKKQGLPFYSESVTYSKKFEIESNENKHYIVKLNEWKGTVADVKVNGENAGIIGWRPYELEISKWVQTGENKIEVTVTGSLKNLLGPHHNNPTLGFVTPWNFFYAPEHQPPGTEYHQLDYGLMADFEILSY